MYGTIKKLVQEKGYGFITQVGRSKDIFFHISGVVAGTNFKDLKEGDKVKFSDIETGNNGKEHAVDVELDLD